MKLFYYSTIIALLSFSIACTSENKKEEDQVQTKTETFKIASYNVRNARGMDNETDFDRVAKVINDIDAHAIAIQELDSATERSNGLVVLDELAKRTNMHASFNGSIDYKGGKYGNGILTKEKPVSKKGVALPGREEKRSVMIVELEDLVLCCTHLSLTEEDRIASIDIIKQHTEQYDSKPVFLAGDLNARPDSQEIKDLSTSWIMLSDIEDPTFPSDKPNRVIDYILLKPNSQFKHNIIDRKVVEEPMASDHRPLWVELEIEWNK